MDSLLQISEVDILPVKPHKGLVAFGSCVVNQQLYLGNIAVHASPDGLSFRLVYPAKVLPNGKLINIFHPINKAAAESIRIAIVGELSRLQKRCTNCRKVIQGHETGWDGLRKYWCEACAITLDNQRCDERSNDSGR